MLRSLADSRRLLLILFAATAIIGLGVVLFSRGGRYGLYADDYSHKLWAYDLERGKWQPRLDLEQTYFRPVGQVLVFNMANALPDWDLAVRLFWASVHLGNVFLAALFALRLTQSLLAMVMTGGVMIFPIQAHEAIFWHSGAASALMGTLSALIAMHLLLSAVSTRRGWLRYAILGLFVYALIPQFYEQATAAIAILPLLVLREESFRRKRLIRALVILLVAVGLVLSYWFLILRHSPTIAWRGGVDLSPGYLLSEALPRLLQDLGWATFVRYEFWGFVAVWTIGKGNVSHSILTILVVVLVWLCAFGVVALAAHQERQSLPSWRRLLLLLSSGAIWLVAALVPVLFVKDSAIESRLLYLPWVGLSFLLASLAALALSKLPSGLARAFALGIGGLFVLLMLTMAGFGDLYQLRFAHDQRQLDALARAVPEMPEEYLFLTPVHLDESSVSRLSAEYRALDRWLLGVFNTDWSAAAAVAMRYGRDDFRAVTGGWKRELKLKGIEWQGSRANLLVNERVVPADRCLAFSYEGGEVVLHDAIVAELPDGQRVRIELPLARQAGGPGSTFQEAILRVDSE